MISLLSGAFIAAAVLPACAQQAPISTTTQMPPAAYCSPAEPVLCPRCSGNNLIDAGGFEYTVTCDYEIQSEVKDTVDGLTSTSICSEACDENKDCFGVNFAPNGSCTIAKGTLTGMSRRIGYSNLLRIVTDKNVTSTSTTHYPITSTVNHPSTSGTSSGTTGTIISSTATPNEECNLELDNLCPTCNHHEVTGKGNRLYHIFCDNTLISSNETYSVQEFSSPESCLADCADFPLCEGAIFSFDRDCQLAKGDDVHPSPSIGYTAFLPVSAPTATLTSLATSTTIGPSKTSAPNATTTIIPAGSGCDLSALCCPACNGVSYLDELNATYTVRCNVDPICNSLAKWRDGAESQEQCLQGCDQDVTCLAALWYPETKGCNLCQQGMDEDVGTNLPFVLLVADVDSLGTETRTSNFPQYPATYGVPVPPNTTTQSITDFPAPFQTSSSAALTVGNTPGPVGPVMWTTSASGSQPASRSPDAYSIALSTE